MSNGSGWALPPRYVGVLVDRCVSDRLVRDLDHIPRMRFATLDDMYGSGAGERLNDCVFLADAGRNGWMVWTQNPKMWRVPQERAEIEANGTHVFCLASAQHSDLVKAFIFGRRMVSILRRHRRDGACFWRIYMHDPPRKDRR